MKRRARGFAVGSRRAASRAISFGQTECCLLVVHFHPRLSADLIAYGLALFELGLQIRGVDRAHPSVSRAFERAGEAIESVVRDGDPNWNERGFYTVVAAAAYHLGHFSARAFSLFPSRIEELNLSPAERALTLLMRRDLDGLRAVSFGLGCCRPRF